MKTIEKLTSLKMFELANTVEVSEIKRDYGIF